MTALATEEIIATDARKVRCRKLDRKLNRCGSEEIEDTGLCAAHLARAHADYLRLTGGKLVLAGGRT